MLAKRRNIHKREIRERQKFDTAYLLPIFGVNIRIQGYEKYFPKILSSFLTNPNIEEFADELLMN